MIAHDGSTSFCSIHLRYRAKSLLHTKNFFVSLWAKFSLGKMTEMEKYIKFLEEKLKNKNEQGILFQQFKFIHLFYVQEFLQECQIAWVILSRQKP